MTSFVWYNCILVYNNIWILTEHSCCVSQVLSSGRSRTVSLGEEGAAGLERMEMEEVGLSEDLELFCFSKMGGFY